MIKTKSIRDPAEKTDGTRILVTRYHPRGYKRGNYDYWLRSLAPSAILLKQWKNAEISWETFEKGYRAEQKNNKAIIDILEQSAKGTITLLCYEPEHENCHRHTLKNIVQQAAKMFPISTET